MKRIRYRVGSRGLSFDGRRADGAGFGRGAVITRAGGETLTAISIPSGWLRVGFSVGDELIFESLATVAYARAAMASRP